MKNISNYKLILASGSPRRRQLLSEAGFEFEVRLKETDEVWPEGLPAEDVPEFLASLKADAYMNELTDGELLITADTVVCLNGNVLGKPSDRDEAISMLKALSGCRHTVVTGVALTTNKCRKTFHSTTDVYFKELSEEEIVYYVDNYRPFDKAGAYGIQEWIGYIGICRIEGSFYNVMGLPVQQLYTELKHF